MKNKAINVYKITMPVGTKKWTQIQQIKKTDQRSSKTKAKGRR